MRKPKSISIIGRRWFRRTYGNTYCTAEIVVDGVCVHKTPKQGGYERHYETIAQNWLEKAGFLKGLEHGGSESLWRYCERRKIQFHSCASDVSRERDL